MPSANCLDINKQKFLHKLKTFTQIIYLDFISLIFTFHRHLDISQATALGSSSLHIANNWNQTGNLLFPSAIH